MVNKASNNRPVEDQDAPVSQAVRVDSEGVEVGPHNSGMYLDGAVFATVTDKTFTSKEGNDIPFREGMVIVGDEVFACTIDKSCQDAVVGVPFSGRFTVKAVRGQGNVSQVRLRLWTFSREG